MKSEFFFLFTLFEKWKVKWFLVSLFSRSESEIEMPRDRDWWNMKKILENRDSRGLLSPYLFLKNWRSIFFVSWPTTKLAFTFPIFKNLTEFLCWLTYNKIGLCSPYFQKFDWVDSMLADLRQNWTLLSLFWKKLTE